MKSSKTQRPEEQLQKKEQKQELQPEAPKTQQPFTMKVNFSLVKPTKKAKSNRNTKNTKIISRTFDSEDETDLERRAAEEEVKRRKLQDEPLVIPLIQSKQENNGCAPLLARHTYDHDHDKKNTATIIKTTNNNETKGACHDLNEKKEDKKENEKQLCSHPTRSNPKTETTKMQAINENSEEQMAMLELIRSAQDRLTNKQNIKSSNDATNFSSSGNLTIPQSSSKAESKSSLLSSQKNRAAEDASISNLDKYHHDLNDRAEDLSASSLAYVQIPISEFGAAMLRGMGWKGNTNDYDTSSVKRNSSSTSSYMEPKPRHHRLGLGATPALSEKDVLELATASPTTSMITKEKNGGKKTNNILEREAILKRKIIDKEQERKIMLQRHIQDGSIVWVTPKPNLTHSTTFYSDNKNNASTFSLSPTPSNSTILATKKEEESKKKRAIMIQTMGVPGLNQVLIQYENEKEFVKVTRKQVVLETQEAMDQNPFQKHQTNDDKQNGNESEKGHHKSKQVINHDKIKTEQVLSCNDPLVENNASKQHDNDYKNSSKSHRHHSRSRSRSRSPDRDRNRYHKSSRRSHSLDRGDRHSKRRHESHSGNRNRERDRDYDYTKHKHSHSRSRSNDRINYRSKQKQKDDYYDNEHVKDNHDKELQISSDFKRRDHNHETYNSYKLDNKHRSENDDGRKQSNSSSEHHKNDLKHLTKSQYDKKQISPFLPNIRVRVISSKVSQPSKTIDRKRKRQRGRSYLYEKGIILDVLPNSKVTLQMDKDRAILEQVPSRYLETVIPKLKRGSTGAERGRGYGNNVVCVLKEKSRGKRGTLLEKNTRDSVGSVQLWEDRKIIMVSFDDMSEWCGGLEEDLEL